MWTQGSASHPNSCNDGRVLLRYSPFALVLVLIALAILWEAAEPEEDPHAAQPLRGNYEPEYERPVYVREPPMPQLPVYDPEVDDPNYRDPRDDIREDIEVFEEIAFDLADGDEAEEIRNALIEDLPGAGDPEVTSRRLLATLNRRRQQLSLVDRLIEQVLPQIEAAQEAGDEDRAEWLEETRARLETRRNAIVESIAEMASTPEDVLSSNDELRSAIRDIRRFQRADESEAR